MKRHSWFTVIFISLVICCLSSNVLAAKELYDDFSGTYLDNNEWTQREFVREIAGGKLVSKLGNSGGGNARNGTRFQNPETITVVECDITVVTANLDSGNNPISFARIGGYLYNKEVSGGATGDIWAEVQIGNRGSGLEAFWEVEEALDDDGNNWSIIGSGTLIGPGTLNPGAAYKVILDYNGTNGIKFSVDGVNDSFTGPTWQREAVTQNKQLGTGIDVDGGSGNGFVHALFDNVHINNETIAYDTFATAPLDQTRWQHLENVREIASGKLRLNVQANGAMADAGINPQIQSNAYLEAKVLVESGSQVSSGASAIARIAGWYYNDSRGPGSGKGYNGVQYNVWVQNRINLDDSHNLTAECSVWRADNPDPWQSGTTLFGQSYNMPINFDVEYTLSIQFTGSSFIFKCNNETYSYNIATPMYPPSDGQFRELKSRVYADSGGTGYMKAQFDDVYMDKPGSVSGQVTGENGPIEDLWVDVFSGPCYDHYIGGGSTNASGVYTIQDVPTGNVYVRACADCSQLNYITEWYDGNDGTPDCNYAAPVTVVSEQNTSGIDFCLETGPKRLQWTDMAVYNGDLNPGFAVLPGFRNDLVSATLSIPNTSRPEYPTYAFDLVNDRFDLWDSECRFIDMWDHDFGPVETGDYGDYTLTLVFSGGAQETYVMTLQAATVTPVNETLIIVTVNDDGSARVSWDLPTTDHQYYQVRVRNISDGKEIYRGSQSLDMNETDISAYDLRCLEIGVNYRWLVRAFDDHNPVRRAETRETTAWYSPIALSNRPLWHDVSSHRGDLAVGFDVRPGSRDTIKKASVRGPGNFSYTFNLVDDWYDMSTETKLTNGWWHQNSGWPLSDGEYTFTWEYDDDLDGTTDFTEIGTRTLSVDSVTAVNSATMEAEIHEDGAITFSWDLSTGVTGQNYEVRIRSADGSKEYFKSQGLYDGTEITASFWDLRAMERGKTYQWFVRAYSHDWDTMEQSDSLTFFYGRLLYSDNIVVGLGTPGGNGYMEVIDVNPPYAHLDWVRVPWPAYNAAAGGTHPCLCNLDNDPYPELVVGLDSYPATGGYVEIRDDHTTGYAHLTWVRVPWPAYNAVNGATYPTCGDFDGDGLNELAIGLGTYTTTGGYVDIRDDYTTGFAHMNWVRVPWPAYNAANGATHPTAGDFDGDGTDELAIGLGTYTTTGGYVDIRDDSNAGFAHMTWTRVPWPAYNAANGATYPTAGDFDGDGTDELAIGLGKYTTTGGYVEIKNDAGAGFAHVAWPRVPWPAYNASNGATYPTAGDFDRDGIDELAIGLGTYTTTGGYVEIKDDDSTGYAHIGWPRVHWPAYNSANGETRPGMER